MAIAPGTTSFEVGDILTASQYNTTHNTVNRLALDDNSRIVKTSSALPLSFADGHWVLAVEAGIYTNYSNAEVIVPSILLYNGATENWVVYPCSFTTTDEIELVNYSNYVAHTAEQDFVYYKNEYSADTAFTYPFIYKCVLDTTAGQSPETSPAKWERISIYIDANEIEAHLINTNNPHNVTATQLGLGSVNNTSDLAKPISTVTQAALDTKAATTHLHTGIYQPILPSYIGNVGKTLAVNSTATGVEWITTLNTVSWGDIVGTLANQSDLQTILNYKASTTHLHTGVYEPANSNIQVHINDSTIHYPQSSIVITESQISDLGNYITDAPTDSIQYARYNNTWVEVEGGNGGGHVIKDSTATFTQRDNLQFTGGVLVTDDATNNATIVNILTYPEELVTETSWDGSSWVISMLLDKTYRRLVNNGVVTLIFNTTEIQSTFSREVTARISNANNTYAIATLTFPSTWRWASGAQPTGLAAGAIAILWIKNITNTEILADWVI